MKTLLVGINTKYIHQNLAIRLLQANTSFPCDIIEFTIKDDWNTIADYILERNYQIVAFSAYLWNLALIKKINQKLQQQKCITIIGGSEVSYEYADLLTSFDYVIKGEGEIIFHHVLDSIINTKPVQYFFNLATKKHDFPIAEVNLENVHSPYDASYFNEHKIFYIETSRGCPYSCSYCMSSLDKTVRYFPLENVFATLDAVFSSKVTTIKFLDRTFNVHAERALKIIDYINQHANDNQIFQFEINLETLSDEIIFLLNAARPIFRLEIGIQTFNEKSLQAINRHQNKAVIIEKSKKIITPIIHADLIAGLPYENLESFAHTYNTALSLQPQELQLGFLKLLKGTKIRREAAAFHYEFCAESPYEIIQNDFVSKADLAKIKKVAHCTEKYYNSGFFTRTMHRILQKHNVFDFFLSLDISGNDFHHLHLALYQFAELRESVILDYFLHFTCKPKKILGTLIKKPEKTRILENIFAAKITPFSLDDLHRHGILLNETRTILIVYKNNAAYEYFV